MKSSCTDWSPQLHVKWQASAAMLLVFVWSTRRWMLDQMRKSSVYALISLIAHTCFCEAAIAQNPVEFRGGLEFLWFDVQGCNRDKFAVLPGYIKNDEIINDRLHTMYQTGQRRLRTAIPLPSNLIGQAPDDALEPGYKRISRSS